MIKGVLKQATAVVIFLLTVTTSAFAVNPDEVLPDAALEERAREISKTLRCVVCRNQSIDDSNSGISRDMRIALRERLVAGDSDTQAVQYLVDRYGEYILLNPPVKPSTYLLWSAPLLLTVLTLWGFSGLWRRKPSRADDPIPEQDQQLLNSFFGDKGDKI